MPWLKTFRSKSGSQLVLCPKLINIIIDRIHIDWYWHSLTQWEIQAYKELFISIWSLWDYTGKKEPSHLMFLLLPSFRASVFNFQLLSWLEISFPYGCLTSDGNAEALCPHKTWLYSWISYNPVRKTKVTPGIWWDVRHGDVLLGRCNTEKVAKTIISLRRNQGTEEMNCSLCTQQLVGRTPFVLGQSCFPCVLRSGRSWRKCRGTQSS